MRTREDIESYLERSTHPYRELTEGTWVVGDPSGACENIVVRMEGNLLLFRMKVLELSQIEPEREKDFYRTLLELNVSDLVHAAYGIADGAVLLTATLRVENVDYNEFFAVIEDFILAMANQHARLAQYHRKGT
jgi:hypothetical protein